MTKTLAIKAVLIWAFGYFFAQSNFSFNDDRIILNLVMDSVYKDKSRGESVFVGEQVFYSLDKYLNSGSFKGKEDPMSLLFLGDWKYLTKIGGNKYSKKWNKISLDRVKDSRYKIKNSSKSEIRFSPVCYSSDGKRAFVIFTQVSNNTMQSTVFFFIEKTGDKWMHKAHYIPFLD